MTDTHAEPPFFDRELSWIAFNGRVLQEAEDPRNPLYARLFFLSIFSSNLDEFFRVRVASLRSLLRLKKKKLRKLKPHPADLLREIHQRVTAQQERFGDIFRNTVVPELASHGIDLADESRVTPEQAEFLREYFRREIRPHVEPVVLDPAAPAPFLHNQALYLVVELWPDEPIALSAEKPTYGLVEVPSPPVPRFVPLPEEDHRRVVMFVDDVVRANLGALFPGREVGSAYAVKLTRDAELYIEDEFAVDLVKAIEKAVARRETGIPSRFLYDLQASWALVSFLKDHFGLAEADLVEGGRYHNLHDLADFPRFGREELDFPDWPPLPHPELDDVPSVLETMAAKDRLLHYPHQSFEHVVRFLCEAAQDPDVEEIWLTVYRVSSDSRILSALLEAAERGKKVRVFVEVKARFDEETNLRWAERMQEAGIVTLYSLPGIKVHAKIALVVRREGGEPRRYAYLGTGNFNEKTARFYSDMGLLTTDPRLTREVERLFHFLATDDEEFPVQFNHCLVAPFTLRSGFYELIDAEIEAVRAGEPCGITAKMNSLEDRDMILRLYEASRAGVPIRLIVRGLCSLVPGEPDVSPTIEVRSILDRYLEHARAYVFHAGGEEKMYLASADWMHRNLSRRVEVAFPLYDPDVRTQVKEVLDIQWADNVKARVIDRGQSNAYVSRGDDEPEVRAQEAIRKMIRRLAEEAG